MNLIRNYSNILDIIDYDKIPFYFELFERKFVLDNNGVRKISKNGDGRIIKVFYLRDQTMFYSTTNDYWGKRLLKMMIIITMIKKLKKLMIKLKKLLIKENLKKFKS